MLHFEPDLAVLTCSDYPINKIGEFLNGLSADGKCFQVPDDFNPASDWCWRFDPSFVGAITKLLNYFNYEVNLYADRNRS